MPLRRAGGVLRLVRVPWREWVRPGRTAAARAARTVGGTLGLAGGSAPGRGGSCPRSVDATGCARRQPGVDLPGTGSTSGVVGRPPQSGRGLGRAMSSGEPRRRSRAVRSPSSGTASAPQPPHQPPARRAVPVFRLRDLRPRLVQRAHAVDPRRQRRPALVEHVRGSPTRAAAGRWAPLPPELLGAFEQLQLLVDRGDGDLRPGHPALLGGRQGGAWTGTDGAAGPGLAAVREPGEGVVYRDDARRPDRAQAAPTAGRLGAALHCGRAPRRTGTTSPARTRCSGRTPGRRDGPTPGAPVPPTRPGRSRPGPAGRQPQATAAPRRRPGWPGRPRPAPPSPLRLPSGQPARGAPTGLGPPSAGPAARAARRPAGTGEPPSGGPACSTAAGAGRPRRRWAGRSRPGRNVVRFHPPARTPKSPGVSYTDAGPRSREHRRSRMDQLHALVQS